MAGEEGENKQEALHNRYQSVTKLKIVLICYSIKINVHPALRHSGTIPYFLAIFADTPTQRI